MIMKLDSVYLCVLLCNSILVQPILCIQ